ncbi:MAG: PhoX family protein [Acidobacteria bacterium]|nr:PhoX family protein [Acidobacteriota bacterium]
MRRFDRRTFLTGSLSTGAALAMQRIVARGEVFGKTSYRHLMATKGNGAYGLLRSTAASNTGEMLLALPEGFQYTVFGKTGEKMSDGNQTPRAHDGMAAFSVKGELRLIRNHEINNQLGKLGVTIGDPKKSYDPMAGGGTTTLVIDPKTRELKRHFVSLSGSLHNCAGGPTPWGSWISCEETVLGTNKFKDPQGNDRGGFSKEHGYCFEVSASSNELKEAVPLPALGRFVHEAIAVDPKTGIVYETEDRGAAGFYRFIPKKKGKLSQGGRLQMLAIKDNPKYDTRTGQKGGAKFDVIWVDIDDPDPASATADAASVYKQGNDKGAAIFARLEGCWYGEGSIFFTATSGGDKRRGQIWQYTPRGNGDGLLTLLFESPDAQVLDGPDNLCVSPRGGLIICEDGGEEQFVRGLTAEGKIFDFARNIVSGFETREFAGATFSPDGQTLFLNIQTPGLTFAVWGPWNEGAL